jgi:hypothetical protein
MQKYVTEIFSFLFHQLIIKMNLIAGYTGRDCKETSACSSNPCSNNAICIIDSHNKYSCICLRKFLRLIFLLYKIYKQSLPLFTKIET